MASQSKSREPLENTREKKIIGRSLRVGVVGWKRGSALDKRRMLGYLGR